MLELTLLYLRVKQHKQTSCQQISLFTFCLLRVSNIRYTNKMASENCFPVCLPSLNDCLPFCLTMIIVVLTTFSQAFFLSLSQTFSFLSLIDVPCMFFFQEKLIFICLPTKPFQTKLMIGTNKKHITGIHILKFIHFSESSLTCKNHIVLQSDYLYVRDRR